MTTEAERERDAYLAEYALDLKPQDVRVKGSTETVRVFHTTHNGFNDGVYSTAELENYGAAPKFHETPNAMVQLIEAMWSKGWRYLLESNPFLAGAHHCTFWEESPTAVTVGGSTGSGSTPMAAVAKSAYAALTAGEGKAGK